MNRNRNAPHPHGRHGRGQVSNAIHEPLETNYTPAEASRLLVACLLQGLFTYARAHEPDRLQSLLSEVDAILDGCLLEEPYQKILDGLQEALDANHPLDEQLIRELALYAGMEPAQMLQLAEEQAVPSYAPYYAEKLRQARLYQSIRAKANQLYNHPDRWRVKVANRLRWRWDTPASAKSPTRLYRTCFMPSVSRCSPQRCCGWTLTIAGDGCRRFWSASKAAAGA